MPQIYEAELSDGRIVEFESDHEPTEADVLAAIQAPTPAPIQPTATETVPQAPSPFAIPAPATNPLELAGMNFQRLKGLDFSSVKPPEMPLVPQSNPPAQPLPEKPTFSVPAIPTSPLEQAAMTWKMREQAGLPLFTGAEPPPITESFLGKWPSAPPLEEVPISKQEILFQAQNPLGQFLQRTVGQEAAAATMRELFNVAKSVPEFATSPAGGLALIGGATVPATTAAIFALDALHSAITQTADVTKNWKSLTPAQRATAIVDVVGATGLGGLLLHGAGAKAAAYRSAAPHIREAKADPRILGFQRMIENLSNIVGKPTGLAAPKAPAKPSLPIAAPTPTSKPEDQLIASANQTLPASAKAASEAGTKKGVQDATQERIVTESRQPEYPRTEEVGIPAETGGGNRPKPAAGLEEKVQISLTPEESAYLEAERGAIDVPVEVSDVTPEGQPFAGDISVADRPNQRIIINPQGFSGWLAKVPTARRAKAVRSLLGEERIHLAVDDPSAQAYWDTLTAAEKAINRRRYTGNWRGINVTAGEAVPDMMIGHEALRFRLQQLARTTPREIAETDFLTKEGFTVRSITAIENALRGVREVLGTKASQEGLAIIERIQGNLDAAKAVLAGAGQPAAIQKEKVRSQEEMIFDPSGKPAEVSAPLASRQYFRLAEDGQYYRVRFDGVSGRMDQYQVIEYTWLDGPNKGQESTQYGQGGFVGAKKQIAEDYTPSEYGVNTDRFIAATELKQARSDAAREPTQLGKTRAREKANILSQRLKQIDAFIASQTAKPSQPQRGLFGEDFPAAIRKGKPVPKEQEAFDLPPVKAGEVVERAGFQTPRGTELESLATRHFDQALAAGEVPNFEKFRTEELGAQFGSIPKADLYYLWQDAMMKRLVTAKGEQVAKLMGQLGVTRDVAQALHPGESAPKLGGSIPDPQIFTRGQQIVMPTLGRIAKAQYARQMMPEQRRRHAALGAIMDKLMEQAGEKPAKPWDRTKIGPEDIMQRYNVLSAATPEEVAKAGVEGVRPPEIESRPMFRTFTLEEAQNPTVVGDIATRGAAVEATGKGAPPRTVSRNLVALKDELGRIVLVSAWRDPRTGPKVTNPLGASFAGEKIDAALLKKWTPMAVMSLRDPVQNYRDVFGSQAAFDSWFGDIAIEGTPGIRTGMFAGPQAGMAEAQMGRGFSRRGIPTPAIENPLAELIESAPVTPSRTARELTMPIERIPPTVVRGEQLPKGPGPVPTLPTPRPPEMLPAMPPMEPMPAPVGEFAYPKSTGIVREYGKPKPLPPGWTLREPGTEKGKFIASGTRGTKAEYYPSHQRYPAAIHKDLAKIGGSLVTKVLVNPLRLYSEWMPERLARAAMEASGGKAATVSEAFRDAANIIIDQEKKNYGDLVDVLDPAKKAAGQFGKDTTWANKPRPITKRAATRNAVDAVEGTIPVPPFAKKVIELGQAANLRFGQLMEKYIPDFKATGKWQRNLTGLGYDVMRQGSGEAWNDWVYGTAKANYQPTYVDAKGKTHRSQPFPQYVEMVKKIFREYKAVLDDPMSDTATIEKVNQDFVRVLPKAITDIKIAGMWQPVIHGNLFNYLESAARRATHAAAFREVFPLAARNAYRKMMEEMRAELPGQFHKDLEALNRALQGHPTDSYADLPLIGPGEPIGEGFRFLNNTLGNFFSKLVLSGQMAVQTGEMISGSTPVFLGYKNFLRAVARLKHSYGALEQTGQVNRVMYDMSWDPASPVRSAFRIGGNVISRTFMEQWSNEMQELHAATTATVVSERIKAGTLDSWERRMLPQTFKAMGFSEAQVGEMMKGNPELLGQFERKAAAFLTSGNKAIAEGSRLGSNRMFNSIFRFQTYPMMKINQLRNVTGNMVDAWQKGTPTQKRASTEAFARFLFGNTVQGILTVGVTSLLYEGLFGTGIRANEAKDEFGNFMVDSFLATVGGPLYLLWRGARDQGAAGIGKQLQRTIFPATIANELVDFAYGTGAYRDRDGFDRIWRFLQQKLPATKAISQGLSMAGLSIEDKKLDAAILAFYRWRRKELGWTDYEPYFREDERREFRMTMRAAVDAMKRGDSDTYVQKLGEATALQGRRSVKSSLQARRLLQSPTGKDLTPEQMDKLRAHIGDAAVEKLEGFDAMLKALAR